MINTGRMIELKRDEEKVILFWKIKNLTQKVYSICINEEIFCSHFTNVIIIIDTNNKKNMNFSKKKN